MTPPPPSLKLAWYGDDFTGATDTLATAALAGLRSLLFLGLPSAAQLARAGPLDALGIAGAARAMTPAEMQAELEPVGRFFASLRVPVMHYKTCSTFDSAPHIGSIGAAVSILQPHAGNRFVPIVGGQPNLRRYCVFGNLFAASGGTDQISRLDRHPTMSRHPVTPMHEADLRLHLQAQGLPDMCAISYTDYAKNDTALDAQLHELLSPQNNPTDALRPVLFDVSAANDLATIGRLIWQEAQKTPLLAAGPSSVVQALAAHWATASAATPARVASAVGPVLVLAGSLSPMTARQVAAARSYWHISLNATRLTTDPAYLETTSRQLAQQLANGIHVLASTSPSGGVAKSAQAINGRVLAVACGELLARVLQITPIKRLGIAGGDTSSHAVQALGAWGLSYSAQLAPGVAMCRLHSDAPTLDGMELMLKGGQMGADTLFEELLGQ